MIPYNLRTQHSIPDKVSSLTFLNLLVLLDVLLNHILSQGLPRDLALYLRKKNSKAPSVIN